MDIAKDKLSILDESAIDIAGSLSFIQPMMPTPMTGPGHGGEPRLPRLHAADRGVRHRGLDGEPEFDPHQCIRRECERL
jgi:hypothetical protein